MSRAVSIRSQLKKYMQRFNLPLESCEGDAKRLARCLVSGYWRNGARWNADGTYRSVRGNMVSFFSWFNSFILVYRILKIDITCSSHLRFVHSEAEDRVGCLSWDGRNEKDTVRVQALIPAAWPHDLFRIRILTEIEPDWYVRLLWWWSIQQLYPSRLLDHGHAYQEKQRLGL